MRRALGLGDDDRPREGTLGRPAATRPGEPSIPQRREADRRVRRFVKDGEVPVVVLSGSREHREDTPAPINRLAAAENAVEAERAARERAERSLQEAATTVQHLQTQIAHANLAHNEALAAERRAREAAEQAREAAEQARAEALVARDLTQTRLRTVEEELAAAASRPGEATKPSVRRSPRTPKAPAEEREPQPVKWWLPSYKAKKARKP